MDCQTPPVSKRISDNYDLFGGALCADQGVEKGVHVGKDTSPMERLGWMENPSRPVFFGHKHTTWRLLRMFGHLLKVLGKRGAMHSSLEKNHMSRPFFDRPILETTADRGCQSPREVCLAPFCFFGTFTCPKGNDHERVSKRPASAHLCAQKHVNKTTPRAPRRLIANCWPCAAAMRSGEATPEQILFHHVVDEALALESCR